MGGGGTLSTAGDYIRSIQMLLRRPRHNGHRVLKAETVKQMSQNHIGEPEVAPLKHRDCRRLPTTSIPGPIRTRNGA